MKCPNCDGKGVVHVRNIHAICGKCKGFGWIDEPQKKPQTNEEWFCGLPTEEKAKWIENKMMWAAQEQGTLTVKGWEKWLKEKHGESE